MQDILLHLYVIPLPPLMGVSLMEIMCFVLEKETSI